MLRRAGSHDGTPQSERLDGPGSDHTAGISPEMSAMLRHLLSRANGSHAEGRDLGMPARQLRLPGRLSNPVRTINASGIAYWRRGQDSERCRGRSFPAIGREVPANTIQRLADSV